MNPWVMNPLLVKGLREEVRSRKLFFLVPIYIGLLSIVALVAIGGNSGSNFNPVTLAGSAKMTLYAFVITITILLGLVAEVLGAASFTLEKERTTFELLELTPLTGLEMVIGKFLPNLIVISLLLLSSLPVLSSLFYMGGLSYGDIFLSLFYIWLFLACVLLASQCLSILSSRTLFSIILSLALGFVVALSLAILTTASVQEPQVLGFMILSPWLVTYLQIFSPLDLLIAGKKIPVWLPYTVFYLFLLTLLLVWACNALDSRKFHRNPWARLTGLVLINGYMAIALLHHRATVPITPQTLRDIYHVAMILIVILTPFFALGAFTEKDQKRFTKQPIFCTFHPKRLWLNDPATGLNFLLLLICTFGLTIQFCSAMPWKFILANTTALIVWIVPWLLLFAGLRFLGISSRGLLVFYILSTLLYILVTTFSYAGKTTDGPLDFFSAHWMIVSFGLAGMGTLIFAKWKIKRAHSTAATESGT